MFDLDAYLSRIGLSGTPGLAEIHLAHCTSIPFEGLDPHMGLPVGLGPADLAEKLLARRRGGYCFEQNLLLAAALGELGHEVELYLARVLLRAGPAEVRPRTHLLLKVDDCHCDVGFGGGTLLTPIPWGPGSEYEQAGWRFRVLERSPELVLQTVDGEQWVDVYSFLALPSLRIDVEAMSWWSSTHPDSRFVTGLMVSRQWADGRRLILSDWGGLSLIARTPAETGVEQVEPRQIPGLLAERFELPGFELRPDGRVGWAGSAPR